MVETEVETEVFHITLRHFSGFVVEVSLAVRGDGLGGRGVGLTGCSEQLKVCPLVRILIVLCSWSRRNPLQGLSLLQVILILFENAGFTFVL